MDTIVRRCIGLDVHKKRVQACLRICEEGQPDREELREFETTTPSLLTLRDWVTVEQVTHIAMESTGVLWKPILNLLEGYCKVLVCNAQHLKQVPERKTDLRDCQWIAQLLQCGLLTGSFIPTRPQRELRDLTRYRVQLIGEVTRAKNRVHKLLSDTNIVFDCVASDIFGVSGLAILNALADGETDERKLAELARGRLRSRQNDLIVSLQGVVLDHHRFMLRVLLDELTQTETLIARVEDQIDQHAALMSQQQDKDNGCPFEAAQELICSIPGASKTSAQAILAEIGPDMRQFPTSGNLASWAGICPGNNETAGKRKSGRTRKGDRWLKRVLTQAAWAATRKKDSYFAAQYRRIARRRGNKRAIVAVAHSILATIHEMLKNGVFFQDLGTDYFIKLHGKNLIQYHLKCLKELGAKVSIDAV